jgi:hypothetical protein
MQKRNRSRESFLDSVLATIKDILFPEEPEAKKERKRNEYYKNPFGGFLP